MSDTDYKGEPIDASWQTAPWNRDGETIEASDDDAHEGNMETIDWPENATPKEELNDDQIAVIKEAAKYPNINTPTKLTQIAVGDKRAYSYSSSVISTHWPERYWVDDSNDDDENDSGNSGLSDSRVKSTPEKVKTVRKRALSGESASKISEDYDASKWTVQGWIKGDHGSTVKSPPPLEYDSHKGRYVPKEDHGKDPEPPDTETESERKEKSTTTATPEPTDTELDKRKALGVVAVAYVIYRLVRRLL